MRVPFVAHQNMGEKRLQNIRVQQKELYQSTEQIEAWGKNLIDVFQQKSRNMMNHGMENVRGWKPGKFWLHSFLGNCESWRDLFDGTRTICDLRFAQKIDLLRIN